MSKFIDYLNKLGERHRKRIEREIKMDEFLKGSKDNCLHLNEINHGVKQLASKVDEINTRVCGLEQQVNHVNGRLEIIGKGTQMELFDTLYRWNKVLTERGYVTDAELNEIEHIYHIYHDQLGGNGQGEKYYNDIKALEERKTLPEESND